MSKSNGDPQLFGHDLFGDPIEPKKSGTLAEEFLFPPFSVLDARGGEWQTRKRAWIALGIESELGRVSQPKLTISKTIQALMPGADPAATAARRRLDPSPGGSPRPACDYSRNERGDGAGRRLTWVPGDRCEEELDEVSRKILAAQPQSGTSIFDPTLCELAYRWFCPKGGQVIDPFAGGSVRGIVAARMGLKYWGCDLRPEQIEANKIQAARIGVDPAWVVGDAIEELDKAPTADLVFTCPPYGDLERYSDDPRDLSTMDYHAFIAQFKRIMLKAIKRLQHNRFICLVVGDFRDEKTGNYRGFPTDTINCMRDMGLGLYNQAILVTSVGSLPIRVAGQFRSSRKLGTTHQHVLVFQKGDVTKSSWIAE